MVFALVGSGDVCVTAYHKQQHSVSTCSLASRIVQHSVINITELL
jgi:hypothetical protein